MNNIRKDVKDNSKTQDNNSFIYIQKIEKIENENKFLKDEINKLKSRIISKYFISLQKHFYQFKISLFMLYKFLNINFNII